MRLFRTPPLASGTPLVTPDRAAGRALVAVIAILTFLASLAAMGAGAVSSRAAEWTSSVDREATIQIRPAPARPIEADLARAADLARETAGIGAARIVSRAEAEDLLVPWLGRGLDTASLPIPRLVVLSFAPGARPDLAALRTRLAEVPGATLDDHAAWLSRLSGAGDALVGTALGLVAVVLAAACLATAFATRGAMAGSRDVVDVLHLVGADDAFIAAEVGGRFLRLGAWGAAIGAGAALLCGAAATWLAGAGDGGPADLLIGFVAPGFGVCLSVLPVALAVGALAGLASRATVRRYLRDIRRS